MTTGEDLKGSAAASLPPEVDEVFREFRTREFSTLARDRTPTTWLLVTLRRPERRRFVLTTSIGMPQKTFNIRRDPRALSSPR